MDIAQNSISSVPDRNQKTLWHFYDRAEDAWRSMKEACINARRSIFIEQYILDDDGIGEELFELLIQKANAGMEVKILCDMVGSYSLFSSNVPDRLREAGIEIRFFNPIRPWRLRNILSWLFRDHRKLMVVDGRIGFIGSVGFRSDMQYWREAHVRVSGAITAEMLFGFEEMWKTAGAGNFFQRLNQTRKFSQGFNFVTNSPAIGRRYLYDTLSLAIRTAETSISITTPYFIPDRRFRRILRLARKRGVSVRILLPRASDVPVVDRASRWFFKDLLKAGVRIFLYGGEMLHAKTVAVDRQWATIGSFNLDCLSFFYNYEANLVSTEVRFVEEVEKLFDEDLLLSEEVLLSAWRERPRSQKIREWLASRIRFIL